MQPPKDVEAYKAERNDVLLSRDPDRLLAFMRKHGMRDPSSRASLIMTMHKTITAVPSLPMEVRQQSKAWLLERGYHALDDGEV